MGVGPITSPAPANIASVQIRHLGPKDFEGKNEFILNKETFPGFYAAPGAIRNNPFTRLQLGCEILQRDTLGQPHFFEALPESILPVGAFCADMSCHPKIGDSRRFPLSRAVPLLKFRFGATDSQ